MCELNGAPAMTTEYARLPRNLTGRVVPDLTGSSRNDVLHLIYVSDEDARLSTWPTAYIDIDFRKDNLRANLAWQRSGKYKDLRKRPS